MFWRFSCTWLELLLAFVLHLLIGSPVWLKKAHPARLVVWLAKFFEGVLREKMGFELRRAGIVLSAVCLLIVFFLGFLLAQLGWVMRVVLISFSFSCAGLFVYPREAAKALANRDITKARQILSRHSKVDTDRISERECVVTIVMQMSHSLCDALIAPLFWVTLFSFAHLAAPAALMWVCIDTLDGRLGNQTRSNADIGYFSAKLSDVAGFLPAWLSGWAVIVGAAICRLDFRRAIRTMDRDRKAHISPNGGWATAAMAGALDIQLGGDTRIGGIVLHRRPIGENLHLPEADDIRKALCVCTAVAIGALAICVLMLAI